MARYVALLRGINVGGKNLINMRALKACFEDNGFGNVVTYIQSGNVLFDSHGSSAAELTTKVEAMLTSTFGYSARVLLRNQAQMRRIVQSAPTGFGKQPDRYRYDVVFLLPPLTPRESFKELPIKEGVDQAFTGPGVLYFSRLVSKLTQSRLNRVASLPIYQNMTLRNWNTTVKLIEMMEARA